MSRVLLEATGLTLSYARRGITGSGERTLAVRGVDLSVARGDSVGIVGESGSGKSSLGRLLVGLERPGTGTVRFDGIPISRLGTPELRPLRRRFQMVFQDAGGSLDPLLPVETIVAEPLLAHGIATGREASDRVASLLAAVGLPGEAARLRPGALSGGERQRVALARALAPEPELLVLDEPVSALDASIRGQVLELLMELRERFGLTLVVISHDLTTVRRLTHGVSVMHAGAFLEAGPTEAVLADPSHPCTRTLLAAEPRLGSEATLPPETPSGPAAAWPPGACSFAPRCPLATDRCREAPSLLEVAPGHRVACHEVGREARA